MKKSLFVIIVTLIVLIISSNLTYNAHSNGGGAPAGYTGSPLENNSRTCSSPNGGCHGGGGVSFQTGLVTSNVPDCGYTPGQTYSITVYVTSPNRTKFGFSISPQLSNGNTGGTMIASAGTQLNGGGRYLTHTSSGTAQTGNNERTWTFDWVAPSAGSGDVTFYAALNATNSNNANTGDLIFNSTLIINEGVVPEAPQVFGNNTACQGNPVNLSTNYSAGIIWQPSGETTQEITVSNSGTYTVQVSTECGNSTSLPFNLVISNIPSTPEITLNSFGNLQSTVIGDFTYNWFLNGVFVLNSDSASFVPQSPGDYTLNITNSEGCESAFSSSFTVNGVGTSLIENKGFTIYPNPSNGLIQIKIDETNSIIKIYDVLGKLIYTRKIFKGVNDIILPSKKGLYYAHFNNSIIKLIVNE